MKKLVCDRCGAQLTEDHDIAAAFEGMEAWQMALRARGAEPRGFYPCKNFVHCQGEMQLVDDNKVARWRRGLMKLLGRQRKSLSKRQN